MVPRKPLAFRQKMAQSPSQRALPFETRGRILHLGRTASVRGNDACLRLDGYPFLHLGPDLTPVGPALRTGEFFAGVLICDRAVCRKCADPCQRMKSAFAKPPKMADSCQTTISERGSITCTDPLSLLDFLPLLPAATVRSTPTAQHLVPSVARPWVPLPIMTLRKVPSRAAFLALSPVIRALAASLTALSMSGATGADASVAFSISRPVKGAVTSRGGRRCSRKS